ncbi:MULTISPECIES: acyl-CoA thioesterase [Mycolicibacter]|uniref:Acyl-CoA thioesterase n=1 Tax=Mycolicibacter kumamotonensis TaxID=354243 RepID=A0A7K3L743_9MYCO|nr:MULTISPECIES: thioesterase family protein [Mycolicibacter]NDJ87940.1 acyl-CoA thioesterase [Mycolicibacter kumamotonensis]RAV03881.1 acyl-CoA thioesterase [Mycolicibacter senuensis]
MTAVLRIEPRWTDLDPIGHVTNSVFLVYAEEARSRLFRDVLREAWESVVVVHNSIDYHRPVELSDQAVEITAVVDAIGTSSLTTMNVITTVAGHRCATVRTVQVVLRDDRSGTRPWDAAERAALESIR